MLGFLPALTTPGSQLGDGSLPISGALTHMPFFLPSTGPQSAQLRSGFSDQQADPPAGGSVCKDGEMGKRGHSGFFRCVTKVLTRVGTLRLYPSTFFPPSSDLSVHPSIHLVSTYFLLGSKAMVVGIHTFLPESVCINEIMRDIDNKQVNKWDDDTW